MYPCNYKNIIAKETADILLTGDVIRNLWAKMQATIPASKLNNTYINITTDHTKIFCHVYSCNNSNENGE